LLLFACDPILFVGFFASPTTAVGTVFALAGSAKKTENEKKQRKKSAKTKEFFVFFLVGEFSVVTTTRCHPRRRAPRPQGVCAIAR
jgi:hypothetical protein